MPLSRSPRTDRRRRTIRENLSVTTDGSDESRVSPSRTTRNAELPELTRKERGVAYSHSVRGACQHRIVQFIPVRKISLVGAVAASTGLPLVLMILHYLVFVSGTLNWAGHPMSALLNANSPRSLAAWMSSHLWLLCLAATVLTFRLRKHKLDDYDGEYRLWFWLVFTCVIGSIDSTTHLTELFGAALDRWSQLHVGWSGTAIVDATLATLIGLLGLRLCSELKAVPASLVLWLGGLCCWAGSAALSQSLFHLEMSAVTRAWLRASLWLGGLTSIWLCSLFYLRATFMEAQKRFLSRAMANSHAIPWQQRLREAMPKLPSFRRSPSAAEPLDDEPAVAKRKRKTRPTLAPSDEADESRANDGRDSESRSAERRDNVRPPSSREREGDDQAPPATEKKRGWSFGLGKLALRPPGSGSSAPRDDQDEEVDREYGKKSGWFGRRKEQPVSDEDQRTNRKSPRSTQANDQANDDEQPASSKRSLRDRFRWPKRELSDEQLLAREEKQAARLAAKEAKLAARRQKANRNSANDAADDETDNPAEGSSKRSWLRMPKPKMPKISIPKPKLPKLKLPSFRLPPPTVTDGDEEQDASQPRARVPQVDNSRPLPSTSSGRPNSADQDQDDNYRNLSKAERKRLKRQQREDDGDRRAA